MSKKKKKEEGDLIKKEEKKEGKKQDNLISNPHDLLVKATLSDPTLFKDKLSVNEDEAMITIAQTIEKRGEKRGMRQGMQQGMQQEKLGIAKSMLKKGFEIKIIEELTGLSKEAIEKLKQY